MRIDKEFIANYVTVTVLLGMGHGHGQLVASRMHLLRTSRNKRKEHNLKRIVASASYLVKENAIPCLCFLLPSTCLALLLLALGANL